MKRKLQYYRIFLLIVITIASLFLLPCPNHMGTVQAKTISYTIKFNGTGSTSGSMKSISCKSGKTYTLPANVYKKSRYSFKCWNTQKDGSGKNYKNKASVRNLTKVNKKTVTLYAQWKLKSYNPNDKTPISILSPVTVKVPTNFFGQTNYLTCKYSDKLWLFRGCGGF